MIELGLVMYIQQKLAGSPPVTPPPGGFAMGELPKDQITPANPRAWAYRSIISRPDYVLNGQTGWTEWDVQIDCHGATAADAIALARAIETALRPPLPHTLPDPDSTVLFGLFRLDPMPEFFSDADRSYVRSLEYTVQYQQI